MSAIEKRFDVRIVTVPTTTPAGEPFGIALARAFGVQLWQAEQIVRDAPVLVKRAVTLEVAQRLEALLTSLGAEAGIVGDLPAPTTLVGVPTMPASQPPSADPPPEVPKPKVPSLPPLALPTARPASAAPPPSRSQPPDGESAQGAARSTPEEVPPWLPRSGEIQLETIAAPPAVVQRPLHDDLASSLLGSALPGTVAASALPHRPRPLPPAAASGRKLPVTTGTIGVAALLVIALAWSFGARWWDRRADAKLLGNTPTSETACKERYCMTGVGVDETKRGRRTIVVAWKSECLDPNYRVFLEGLAAAHPGDLEVVGVVLTVPETNDPRALGLHREPTPSTWPPNGCTAHFDTLPPDRGYASDWLSPPVTYLSDADGKLIAVWRGGMVQEQRDRLSTWLDGKAWEGNK